MTTTLITIFAMVSTCMAFTAAPLLHHTMTVQSPSSTSQQQQHQQQILLRRSASVSEDDAATVTTTMAESPSSTTTVDPLLIRAARGDTTIDRTPVWMMRQAGRHIQAYRELCQTYPTFRQRSEITEVAVEVSLQPWRNYQTDGCILFSDILTPLPGMGCDFIIDEQKGPVMMKPITTYDDLQQVMNCNIHMLWLVLSLTFCMVVNKDFGTPMLSFHSHSSVSLIKLF